MYINEKSYSNKSYSWRINCLGQNKRPCVFLGAGCGIVPSEGKVFAPFDAKVEVLFETKHAIGLTFIGLAVAFALTMVCFKPEE